MVMEGQPTLFKKLHVCK